MVKSVSEKSYFYFSNNAVTLSPRKDMKAREFLKTLLNHLTTGASFKICDSRTLNEIVDTVVSGYERKRGIVQRIWECFVNVMCYFVRSFEVFRPDTQMIHHYANEIKNADQSKVAILPSDDPASKLKMAMIDVMSDRQKEITKATQEECIQLVLTEHVTDKQILLQTAELALEINDPYSANAALLAIEEKRGDLRDEDLSIFFRTIAACVLVDDVDGTKKLIAMTEQKFYSFSFLKNSEFEQLMTKSAEAGKMSTLIAAMNTVKASTEFYAAAAKECIKNKDRKSLVEIKDKIPEESVLEAIDLYLEDAKQDKQAYDDAHAIAKVHRFSIQGFECLMKIFDHILKLSKEYEVALGILKDVQFFRTYDDNDDQHQFKEKICRAVDQLTHLLIQNELYALAGEALQKSPANAYRHLSPLKELALEVYAVAMQKKEYTLAIIAARSPLFIIISDEEKTSDVKQQRENALARLEEIATHPLSDDDRESVDQSIEFANRLLAEG